MISVGRRYFDIAAVPEDVHVIPSVAFEKCIIECVHRYLALLREFRLAPPFALSLGMFNLHKSFLITGPSVLSEGLILTRDEILPPPLIVPEEAEGDYQGIARLLRPVFDYVWREYNYPCSLNYSQAGDWVGQ